jgi:hypothetical protein
MQDAKQQTVFKSALILRKAGRRLFGEDWQGSLSLAIGVSPRSIRRWSAGEEAVPPGIWRDIRRTATERSIAAKQIADDIDALFASEVHVLLEPIPNTSPTADASGVAFMLQTSVGRRIRCYVRREVLDDRVKTGPFINVLKYLADHEDAFRVATQRKFDSGQYDETGIEIGNNDVSGLDLPDERYV